GHIRRLTPLEYWRLQGFTDEHFFKAKAAGVSDRQLYKQAGNAVTVNVIEALANFIKKIEKEKELNE
ncbi:MAG: DNA cytosine methyltransferase, partial [Ruminococcus sp.]|nr:DNA cytosine methyltransferase [Ruminococcus sp.]